LLFLIFYGNIQYDEIGSPLFFSPRSNQKASHTLPFVGLLFAFGKFTESFLLAVTGRHRGGLFRPWLFGF
jgi:hypothetical protein